MSSLAPVAQWIEYLTSNQSVACSNHAGGITFGFDFILKVTSNPQGGGRCQSVACSNHVGGIFYTIGNPRKQHTIHLP